MQLSNDLVSHKNGVLNKEYTEMIERYRMNEGVASVYMAQILELEEERVEFVIEQCAMSKWR